MVAPRSATSWFENLIPNLSQRAATTSVMALPIPESTGQLEYPNARRAGNIASHRIHARTYFAE
jgi:hypothetical protein